MLGRKTEVRIICWLGVVEWWWFEDQGHVVDESPFYDEVIHDW